MFVMHEVFKQSYISAQHKVRHKNDNKYKDAALKIHVGTSLTL